MISSALDKKPRAKAFFATAVRRFNSKYQRLIPLLTNSPTVWPSDFTISVLNLPGFPRLSLAGFRRWRHVTRPASMAHRGDHPLDLIRRQIFAGPARFSLRPGAGQFSIGDLPQTRDQNSGDNWSGFRGRAVVVCFKAGIGPSKPLPDVSKATILQIQCFSIVWHTGWRCQCGTAGQQQRHRYQSDNSHNFT